MCGSVGSRRVVGVMVVGSRASGAATPVRAHEGEVRVRGPVFAWPADGTRGLMWGALVNVQRLLQPSSRLTWEEFK